MAKRWIEKYEGKSTKNVENSRRPLPMPKPKMPQKKLADSKKKQAKGIPNYQELARKRVTGQI